MIGTRPTISNILPIKGFSGFNCNVGPLLFMVGLHINEMVNTTSLVNIIMFADETNMFFPVLT